MAENKIADKVRSVFLSVFPGIREKDFDLGQETADVEGWDSLGHMALVAELEKEFNVHFEIDEISEMDSVKNVLGVVAKKVNCK